MEDYQNMSAEEMAYQQAMQSQQYNQPMFTPQEDRTDLLLYTFYSHDVISQFRRYLRGEVKDGKGALLQVRQPLANDRGINGMMVHIELAISKLTNLSDIDVNEVYMLARIFEHNLFNDMWINRINWAMQETNLIALKDLLGTSVFLTLKRAQEGGDRGLIGKTHRSAATISSGATGGRSGALNNIMKGLFK